MFSYSFCLWVSVSLFKKKNSQKNPKQLNAACALWVTTSRDLSISPCLSVCLYLSDSKINHQKQMSQITGLVKRTFFFFRKSTSSRTKGYRHFSELHHVISERFTVHWIRQSPAGERSSCRSKKRSLSSESPELSTPGLLPHSYPAKGPSNHPTIELIRSLKKEKSEVVKNHNACHFC